MSSETAVQEAKAPAVPALLSVSSSPHVHRGVDTARVMWEVLVYLLPAMLAGVFFFRMKGFFVILACAAGAVAGEWLVQKFLLRVRPTLHDGSALLTGVLLALCVPSALPLGMGFVGGFLAIAIGKQVYGGLGQNIFNPAHVARAVLLASWPAQMTTWFAPLVDGKTTATPLAIVKYKLYLPENGGIALPSYWDLVLGHVGGCIGETSALALIIGGLVLALRGHIFLETPLVYIGTVYGLMWVWGWDPFYQILAGGLMLGAFFMATDMVTSPITRRGQIIFALGCGLLTFLIRVFGAYPEGVCYSILIMNAFVPLIDRYTVPRKFGRKEAN